ncbi:MAG: hypothetical protein MZU95_12540 [Desulfomicrobium escambiense]|nr:hypothetical protein [Desulfomicrobium escambiense]
MVSLVKVEDVLEKLIARERGMLRGRDPRPRCAGPASSPPSPSRLMRRPSSTPMAEQLPKIALPSRWWSSRDLPKHGQRQDRLPPRRRGRPEQAPHRSVNPVLNPPFKEPFWTRSILPCGTVILYLEFLYHHGRCRHGKRDRLGGRHDGSRPCEGEGGEKPVLLDFFNPG